tara:strand:- start:439 stop:867 length:429 start_codon:yes stop_codon:yes gene_type:complete
MIWVSWMYLGLAWIGGSLRKAEERESRVEVDHKHVVENGFEDGYESFVIGVGQVFGSRLFVVEGDDKAVGESFVEPFGAVVFTPLERMDPGNLSFQGGEFSLDFFYLRGISAFLELEAHDMADFLHRGALKGRFLIFGGRFG